MTDKPLHAVIDARLRSGVSGGIESVVIGLAGGLSKLGDDGARYTFLVYPNSTGWIEPYVDGPCRLHPAWGVVPHPPQVPPNPIVLAEGDGTVEALAADVVHFPIQRAFLTRVPSVYHPHDLQHLHLPQFFDEYELRKRALTYPAYCRQAAVVAVAATWVKDDVVRRFDLPPEKVRVVPLAPIVGQYAAPAATDLARVREAFALPPLFAFYPAQTWPHKNHAAMLDALALLRDRRGIVVPLVCCGRQTDHFAAIESRVRELGLTGQVRFLGFVTPADLRCLQHLCTIVVIPTLFEAASGPLNDAFLAGAPAACSNVTSLPRQAGDAALVFDPRDPADIARAVERLWTDADLRRTLAERGRARVSRFTWDRTARHFRALYRQIAKRPLTDEDRHLLTAEPGI